MEMDKNIIRLQRRMNRKNGMKKFNFVNTVDNRKKGKKKGRSKVVGANSKVARLFSQRAFYKPDLNPFELELIIY